MQKNNRQMMASLRVISLVMPFARDMSRNSTTRAVEISRRIGSSFLTVSLFTLIGQIIAAIPMRSRTLMMLLPMTLPSSISVEPEASELIDTASSGALVPKATTVRPMRIFDTLKLVAMEDAPATSQSAPLIRIMKPAIRSNSCINISIVCFDYVYIIHNSIFLKKWKGAVGICCEVCVVFDALRCGKELFMNRRIVGRCLSLDVWFWDIQKFWDFWRSTLDILRILWRTIWPCRDCA